MHPSPKPAHPQNVAAPREVLERLRVSEERLRLALESNGLGAWSYDARTGHLETDARCRSLFGAAPDVEPAPEVLLAALHAQDQDRVEVAIRAALAGEDGGGYDVEYRVKVGGEVRWVAARGQVRFGMHGEALTFTGTVRDVTREKRAERFARALHETATALAGALSAEDVARAVVQHGLEPMDTASGWVSVLQDGRLELLASFGYTPDQLAPWRSLPLSPGLPHAQVMDSGRPAWVGSREQLRRDFPAMPASLPAHGGAWCLVPVCVSGHTLGVLGLGFPHPRAFTLQEQGFLRTLGELAGQALERARLYDEEHQAREEARRVAHFSERLIGIVSHDLRNPLQAVMLGAQGLLRTGGLADRHTRMVRRILNSADLMGRITGDLLDLTRGRLGSGIPLAPTEADLCQLVQEVTEEFATTHPERAVELTLPGRACRGQWDRGRLRQLLVNLLSNAVRHAAEGTPVGVRVRCAEQHVELEVHNAGDPISAELLPTLFEPVDRRPQGFRPAGSLGLGLYIVRLIAEAHGGWVQVRSGKGAGTAFTVRLALTPSPRSAPHRTAGG